jgi:hypothetical protein
MGNAIPFPQHHCGHEPMYVVEIGKRKKSLTGEQFEAASGVSGAIIQQPLANAVSDARRHPLDPVVLPLHALTRDKP